MYGFTHTRGKQAPKYYTPEGSVDLKFPNIPKVGPEGSKDPNNRVFGPKYNNTNGIWALKPYYLGPWTHKG